VDITAAVRDNHLRIEPFEEANVQPTSYDIGVMQIIQFPEKQIYGADDDEEIAYVFDQVVLQPDDSLLFLSREEFAFPLDMMADIYLRSRYSRLLNSGEYMGRIECGWSGHLVLEIANHSLKRPVSIWAGECLATLVIYQLENAVPTGYTGRYQNWLPSKERKWQ
jgi:dCTP deaminase